MSDDHSDAMRDVLAERHRQVTVEGWTAEHDDQHDRGELARAACCYAYESATRDYALEASLSYMPLTWPWSRKWWKPKSQRRDLVRAAALLIAEIERLDRISRAQSEVTP